ncbi:MAG: hypothetical protein N3G20_04280, partial [Verrucomicrobiae bacterium]|nr:hypothetical protein [Verrucomicrobiae bacterium]
MNAWMVQLISGRLGAVFGLLAFVCACGVGIGADIDEARRLFLAGQYAESARVAEAESREKEYSEQWPLLLVESLQAIGRYE